MKAIATPPTRSPRPLGRALFALLLWGAGCQVLVDGEITVVHCQAEGALGPPACPAGLTCKQGTCVDAGEPAPSLGTPCARDADCAPGDLCLDPQRFGAAGAPSCSRPCCTSSDCDPALSFVCWTPSLGGASYCRDAALDGRHATGAALAGEPCRQDEDCRSAICDTTTAVCVDTCCSDVNCAGDGSSCRLGRPEKDRPGFWCASDEQGDRGMFEPCDEDANCASGLCLAIDNVKRCSAPCCNSASCGVFVRDGRVTPVACTYVAYQGVALRACAQTLPSTATKSVGDVCERDADCRSGVCASMGDGALRCSDACCDDANCGDASRFECRPILLSISWALRCEPK